MTPRPHVTIHRFGREQEPVVQVDDFSGMPDKLLEAGRKAEYQPGGASYPGIRAWADPSYLDLRRDLMFRIMQAVFGFRQGVAMEVSTFSLVTLAPETLAPLQRIPHFDHAAEDLIAVMHYLQGPETGGTAFYRHRRTGFETITPEREAAYDAGLAADEREYGMPQGAYYHGDGRRYEQIGEIAAKPDRLILYRGRLLHSGVIPDPEVLTDDPRTGRLTINMFLRGR
ncbi:MAG: DUF6445 family protein [Alteraurantiacibacter sp.]